MNRDNWSVTDLDELYKEASQTLALLPSALKKNKLNYWPDYKQNYWEVYNYHSVGKVRITPTANQVSRLEFALAIGLEIDRDDNQLIWKVASTSVFRVRGIAWLKLAKHYRCDRRTVKRRYEQALIRLYYHLKKS